MVRSIFLPFEANTILKIPLSYNLPKDSLIWIGNKRGILTVKSAYYIASSLVVSNKDGESSSINLKTSLWKRIWHQEIPPKLKIFAWRTCVNDLPTMYSLNHRGIHCSSFCPLYDKAFETTAHVLQLWSCQADSGTLAQLSNWFNLLSSRTDGYYIKYAKKGSSHDLELFFAMAWSIWWNHNQALHEDSSAPPRQIWDMANRTLVDYKEACSYSNLPLVPPSTKWRTPLPPCRVSSKLMLIEPQMMASPLTLEW